METFQKKSTRLFIQLIGIGALLIIIFSGVLYTSFSFTFSTLGEILARQASVACGCQIASNTTNYPLFGLLSILGLSAVATITVAIGKTLLAFIKTREFLQLQEQNITSVSSKLLSVAKSIGVEKNIVEIQTSRPLIFCYGLRHTTIYISSTVVAVLHHAELRAVLLHEAHHLIEKEPARLIFIKFISVFTFIPGIKTAIKKYLSLAEIAADELATEQFANKKNLASAMTKILDLEEQQVVQKELAVSYFSQMTEDRISVLSNKKFQPTTTKELLKVGATMIGGIMLLLFLSANVQKQEVRAQEVYTNSGCTNKILVEECRNLWTNCVGQKFHERRALCSTVDKSYLQK